MTATATGMDMARSCRGRWLWAALCLAATAGAQVQDGGQVQAPAARAIAPLDASTPIGYFIAAPEPNSGARDADPELCLWALEDWVGQAGGRISVEPATEAAARIRVYFVTAQSGRYGEMRPVLVDGRRGAEVYVRPDTTALGPDIARAAAADPLLREAIVYLTCLHEIGHALGMLHTDVFDDVMYFFGFGGDIPAFFGRYRARLETRGDIRRQTGLSAGDLAQLRAAYD